MNKIKVEGAPMSVHSGQVQLSGEQAKPRMHALTPIGKVAKDGSGLFEVTGTINFKVGETFVYSGELSKTGELRDLEAEALAKLETEDRIRAEIQAKMQKQYEQAIAEASAIFDQKLKSELEKAAAVAAEVQKKALTDQEAKLRAELAPK